MCRLKNLYSCSLSLVMLMVTMTMLAPHAYSQSATVDPDGTGSNDVLTVIGGGFSPYVNDTPVVSVLSVGHTSSGTLELNSGFDLSITDDLNIGTINGASGWMNILGGSTATVTNDTSIGFNANTNGTVVVDGVGSRLDTRTLNVGFLGTGALNILNGGQVTSTTRTILGNSISASGTVTVNGTGSALAIHDDLWIGNAGAGSLEISDGGLVDIAGDATLGNNPTGRGTLNLNGGTLRADNLVAGSGSAAINFSSGELHLRTGQVFFSNRLDFLGLRGNVLSTNQTIRVDSSSNLSHLSIIDGGRFISHDQLAIIADPIRSGPVSVSGVGSQMQVADSIGIFGGGSLLVTGGGTLQANSLGSSSGGEFRVDGNHSRLETNNDLRLGTGAVLGISDGALVRSGGLLNIAFDVLGTTGVNASGTNTRLEAERISVGDEGSGFLNINNGAVVNSDLGVILGNAQQALGSLTLSGIGSRLDSQFNLIVGSEGLGTVNIADGAIATADRGITIGSLANSNGFVTVAGANSRLEGGLINYVGRTGNGTLNVSSGALVELDGEVWVGDQTGSNGTVTVSGTGSRLNATRNLLVGTFGTGTVNLINDGVADVDGYTVLSDFSQGSSTINIHGGKLATNDIVFGQGDATINFTRGTLNLRDDLTLTTDRLGRLLGGDRLFAGRILQLDGTTTIEDPFHIDGGLFLANDVINNAGTDFTIAANSEAIFSGRYSGGSIGGEGTATFAGLLDPGFSPGTFEFDGDLNLTETSELLIELAGTDVSEFDRLLIAGDVNLDGQLTIDLLNGFELEEELEFLFLEVGGDLTGSFNGLAHNAFVGSFGGHNLFISYTAGDGNDVALFTAVPEPGTAALLCLAGLVVGMRRRRR